MVRFLVTSVATIGRHTNALVFVRTDARENDKVLLTALKRVDGGDFDLVVQSAAQRARARHLIDNVRSLTLVRRNHANLPCVSVTVVFINARALTERRCSDTLYLARRPLSRIASRAFRIQLLRHYRKEPHALRLVR